MELKQGYSDGSGMEYITLNNDGVLKARWGCSCCQDTSELTKEENALIQRIVLCCNSHDALVEAFNTYGGHLEDCNLNSLIPKVPNLNEPPRCDCGFDEALAVATTPDD